MFTHLAIVLVGSILEYYQNLEENLKTSIPQILRIVKEGAMEFAARASASAQPQDQQVKVLLLLSRVDIETSEVPAIKNCIDIYQEIAKEHKFVLEIVYISDGAVLHSATSDSSIRKNAWEFSFARYEIVARESTPSKQMLVFDGHKPFSPNFLEETLKPSIISWMQSKKPLMFLQHLKSGMFEGGFVGMRNLPIEENKCGHPLSLEKMFSVVGLLYKEIGSEFRPSFVTTPRSDGITYAEDQVFLMVFFDYVLGMRRSNWEERCSYKTFSNIQPKVRETALAMAEDYAKNDYIHVVSKMKPKNNTYVADGEKIIMFPCHEPYSAKPGNVSSSTNPRV